MKVTNGLSLFLQFDRLHDRIDLQRPTAHVLAMAAAVWWAALDWSDARQFLLRLVAIVTFAIVGRLLLTRLGVSRLAAFVTLAITLLLTRSFLPEHIMLLNLVALTVLLAQEYFLLKTKGTALLVGLAMAVLAAGAGVYESRLLVVFMAALTARLLWHALIERMGRKQFILFGVKTVAMLVITPAVWWLLRSTVGYQIKIDVNLPAVTLPAAAAIVGGLLVLRGIWVTLLLKTDKSPKERGLRIFYALLAAILLTVTAVMNRYAGDIFLPDVFITLYQWGLITPNPAMSAYALLSVGLFFTAGIDRSLYKDTSLSRAVRRKLAPPSQQVRSGKQD